MGADTIAALATASGTSALAVVRISGPSAFAVFGTCLRNRARFDQALDRTMTLYTMLDPENGTVVDHAMAVRYKGPRSYTGEDMVEVFTHGGDMVPSLVLAALFKAGARLAEPGEFTRRAVVSGKMDVLSAEAVNALIGSGSLEEHQAAMDTYRGGQQGFLGSLRERLEGLLARLEADMEFGEEQGLTLESLRAEVAAIRDSIQAEVEAYRRGARGRGERRIVIAGEPNAGKSTLFNGLVGGERSIVHGTAGTTRDYVAEAGAPGADRVVFVDTAGFGLGDGEIVARSVARTWEQVDAAAGVVWVSSAQSEVLTEGERRLAGRARGRLVGVVSKCDLADGGPKAEAMRDVGVESTCACLIDTEGLAAAVSAVHAACRHGGARGSGQRVILNARQEGVLVRMAEEADALLSEPGGGEDAVAYGVNGMLRTLGELTGARAGEAILDEVFGRFCVGK